jgi:hypothetical protein
MKNQCPDRAAWGRRQPEEDLTEVVIQEEMVQARDLDLMGN